MLCRITDEKIYNPYDKEDEEMVYEDARSTSLEALNLYELMGQDFDVYVKNNESFGFDIEITSEDNKFLVQETGVHPCAVESFANFCKQFVVFYEKSLNSK